MVSLVTLPEIKDFLSIKTISTDEDGRLANISVQVGTLVESYCGRSFLSNNYVEYFDGGISSVFVSQPPINQVDEVAQFDGTQYQLLGGPGSNGEPIITEGQSHAITNYGNPLLKTRVKKFNRSSLFLDGSSYLLTDTDEDWDFGVDSFTIESQVRFNSVSSGTQTIVSSGTTDNYWQLSADFDSAGLNFTVVESGVETVSLSQGATTGYAPNQFYHLALVRNETALNLYRDGVSIASITTSNNIPNWDTGLSIGKGISGDYLTGYIDDFKISHVPEYISNFTAPTNPTRIDENTKLILRCDGTNNSPTIEDVSRLVNEYTFYKVTGEISFNTGVGGGTESLSFFRPLQFQNYPNGVRVSYNGGYSSIPSDLKLAALEMIKVIYKGRSGSETVRFQGDSSTSHKLSVDEFPPQVRRVLNLYRLVQ